MTKKISLKLILFTFLIFTTLQSSIHHLVNKLFDQLCQQDSKQTISLYQCQPHIIQHDKKMGTYRAGEEYKMESFYMMVKYDGNKDQRLSRQETLAMAYDIVNGVVNERQIKLFWRDFGPKDQKADTKTQGNTGNDQNEQL